MKLQFTKMHGCGNDYMYLDCRQTGLPEAWLVWRAAEEEPRVVAAMAVREPEQAGAKERRPQGAEQHCLDAQQCADIFLRKA